MSLSNEVVMKKFFLGLAIFLFSLMTAFGVESLPHTNLISPKCIRSKFHNKISKNDKVNFRKTIIEPKIHHGFWPYFCPMHLLKDPAACGSWDEDKNGNMQLDFVLFRTAEAYYDPELIQRISSQLDLIPKNDKKLCDYAWCSVCKQTVLRGVSYNEGEEDEDQSLIYFPVYKCKCTGKWWIYLDDLDKEDYKIYNGWKFCHAETIYPGYVDWHSKPYFRFLKRHLKYIEENPCCDCYWPEVEPLAKEISNLVYSDLLNELKTSNLDNIRESFHIPLAERSQHGFLSGLLTHAFFYSDYHAILTDFDQHCFKELLNDYPKLHEKLLALEEKIQTPFLAVYNRCLQKHPHPKVYYERGMVLYHQGENLDSLEDIRKFIAYAEKNNYQELLTSDLYLNEGRLLSESLSYDEAIVALTKAISKDPGNKETYFERAIAYFEVGDFQKALSDYLASGFHPKAVDPKPVGKLNSLEFGQGIVLGMLKGGKDSGIEFVPSLLSSLRGLGRGMWAFVSNPIAISQDMIESAHACMNFIKETTTQEHIDMLIIEIQECLKKWDNLNDDAKGKAVGYVIGKYGVDVFIGSRSIKAIQLYRNLRKSNALMTLETASSSQKHAKEVLELCSKEYEFRENLFKSGRLKIDWGDQNKHIPGKHNYLPDRSVFENPDAQNLIKNFAGTGQKMNNVRPGEAGYKELVNFGEHIGIWKNKEGTLNLPTTRGVIHYSKSGCHIVPAKPNNF